MRLDRLTQKTREALLTASQHAAERGHPEVHPEHLTIALFAQPDGLAPAILTKAGADPRTVVQAAIDRSARLPSVQGGAEPTLSRSTRELFTRAWGETEKFGDEYTSAEHVLLAMTEDKDQRALLGVSREDLQKAVSEVRGTQKVTDPNPEGKFPSRIHL